MSDIELMGFVLLCNLPVLWLEIWDMKRKAKKYARAVEARLAALESGSEEARYMGGTWLS
jgi:hypothetical protein